MEIKSVGSILEEKGWLQGCFIPENLVKELLKSLGLDYKNQKILVISQSCDIAHYSEVDEPEIELIICNIISQVDGMFINSRNPRKLHITAVQKDLTAGGQDVCLELLAKDKKAFNKSIFTNHSPESNLKLDDNNKRVLCNWLSSRYSRLALPTEFNNRMSKMKNFAKYVKKTNSLISGLFIKIEPNTELLEGETYTVNILALVSADNTEPLNPVEDLLDAMKIHMKANNIEVFAVHRSENDISVATLKGFQKYSFDHLSFRSPDYPKSPEI